ncbi:hypothetical protein H8F21_11420 [Pseudomonas sp. P66]|uniref:MarR family transcriptional regulator n=1 Tax=Pseudomonas arcuscaelestis TaxID=2710591 RepID=A0ABS2BYN3_9PSED|nr:hypothetical protein [Pseudomonas arcuscaelestis]MBM5458168.1 hypothetical protein [Pseudomonas arcuscaelestis]
MFLSALFCEVKGLGPEGKYFLVRFIQRFGIAETVDLGVKALAKQFGLSDRQVSGALTTLVALDVMSFSSTPEGKGRPKRCYQLKEDFYKKLESITAFTETQHEVAIGSLLRHESKKVCQASEKPEEQNDEVGLLTDLRSKKQPDRLTVVNRLLLSVLLCRADRFGVVKDLGFATLCKLTGLNKERLRHRLGRLIDQGLIRTYVPGATNPIFARKMKSIYYLNLDHPELAGVGSATSILVCMHGAHKIDDVMHAYRVRREVYCPNEASRALNQGTKYEQFVRHFATLKEPAFELLQVMVERYAAYLLSRYWSDLLPGFTNKRIVDLGLRELISMDFRPSTQPPEFDGDGTTCSGREQFIDVLDELCHWAYRLAFWIKTFFGEIPNVPFDCMDFVIIPQPIEDGYIRIALLALPRSLAGWSGCLVVAADAAGGEVGYFPIESDIPIEHRYNYGLLTAPGRARPGRPMAR